MTPHRPVTREAREILEIFLSECVKDRTYESLPLRDLTDSECVWGFEADFEHCLRGILADYTIEQRSNIIQQHVQRQLRPRVIH